MLAFYTGGSVKTKRRIEMRTQHHLTVPYIVTQTQLLGSVPESSIKLFLNQLKANIIKIHKLPFNIPNIDIYFFWHKIAELDSTNSWLRNNLIEYFKEKNKN